MVPPGESANRAGRPGQDRPGAAPDQGGQGKGQPRAKASGNGKAPVGASPGQRWRKRLRSARRLGLAAIGCGASVSLLGLVWPQGDPADQPQDRSQQGLGAELPSRPISLLVIGSDGERRGAVSNGAAPAGPANSDALMLVRLAPKQPLDVLVLPIEAAIKLPGQSQPVALGSLYRRGGPALVASVTAELLGLPKGQPDRFLVMPRLALRKLVDGLGQVELAPERTMLYTDRSQSLHIDLQPGLQLLDGDAMEQFLRFRDPDGSEEGRRQRLKASLAPLLQQMGHPQQLQQLPDLLRSLQDKVETNLSPNEALSLVAAALQPGTTLRFHSLPLLPPLGAGAGAKSGLRQLAVPVGQSDWPQI
jgi:LCP family protein required for cell wall assembly